MQKQSLRRTVIAGKTLGQRTDEAWLRGRQIGYDAGVEAERTLVLKALEVEAKERDRLGLKDEAHAIRFIAEDIRAMRHVSPDYKAHVSKTKDSANE